MSAPMLVTMLVATLANSFSTFYATPNVLTLATTATDVTAATLTTPAVPNFFAATPDGTPAIHPTLPVQCLQSLCLMCFSLH